MFSTFHPTHLYLNPDFKSQYCGLSCIDTSCSDLICLLNSICKRLHFKVFTFLNLPVIDVLNLEGYKAGWWNVQNRKIQGQEKKKTSRFKRQTLYLRKSLLFSTVFIPMFSKERAKRGLIEYQLKVTGEAMRITMYKIFFVCFFFLFTFFFSATNVQSGTVHSVIAWLLLVFSKREHLLQQYYWSRRSPATIQLWPFFLSSHQKSLIERGGGKSNNKNHIFFHFGPEWISFTALIVDKTSFETQTSGWSRDFNFYPAI